MQICCRGRLCRVESIGYWRIRARTSIQKPFSTLMMSHELQFCCFLFWCFMLVVVLEESHFCSYILLAASVYLICTFLLGAVHRSPRARAFCLPSKLFWGFMFVCSPAFLNHWHYLDLPGGPRKKPTKNRDECVGIEGFNSVTMRQQQYEMITLSTFENQKEQWTETDGICYFHLFSNSFLGLELETIQNEQLGGDCQEIGFLLENG